MSETDRSWDRLIGDRVRLRELRILHTVIRCGSMAKAAVQLSMTQPAISHAIGLLEAAIGVPMLERSPAGVRPTEFGEAILRRALDAMDALSEGLREVALLSDPSEAEVVVGASESYIAGGVLARTLRGIASVYPRMRVHIVESNTAAMDFTDLRHRRVDIMLGRLALTNLPDDIQADVLLHETLLVVTSRQNGWAGKPGLSFADLADKRWVLAPPGTAVYELVAKSFQAEGLAMPPVTISTWSMLLRLQLLAGGDYLTAFPESLVRENAQRWNLQVVPVQLGHKLPVAALTLRSRTQNRAIRAFVVEAMKASGEEPTVDARPRHRAR